MMSDRQSYRYYWQAGWETGNPEWLLDPDPDGWNSSYGVSSGHLNGKPL
ncbi:MAG: hypothetical protein IPH20_20440 [Bacteroidales bacterium]|nr:hypothetical protein [Bacteroidales bacterium]